MTQTAYDISVIICAYTQERWDDLIAAIESVQRQSVPPREIIVVIDYNQGLMKRVREQVSGVVVAENTEAPGLSGTRNSGIAVAKSQIVAFLDDDAMATPDWLIKLSEGFTDPQVLGIGGPVIPLWPDKAPPWLPEEFYWVVGCTYRGMPQSEQAIRNPIGANMAFRRGVFDTVGGFRSGIGRVGMSPVGCEETELCIRARQHWPERMFIYQPQATVFHRISSHRTHWHYFYSRCYAEGLSKGVVASYVGTKDALASERTYILRILPQGIVRGLADALHRDDLIGLARAGAIMFGLMVTMAGYLVGSTILQVDKLRTKRKNFIAREEIFLYNLPPSIKAEP